MPRGPPFRSGPSLLAPMMDLESRLGGRNKKGMRPDKMTDNAAVVV